MNRYRLGEMGGEKSYTRLMVEKSPPSLRLPPMAEKKPPKGLEED
jgi:hypothetical protein